MSKQYPECPLYNHRNCREIDIKKVCAIVRKDKKCLRKFSDRPKLSKKVTAVCCIMFTHRRYQ